MCIRLIKQHHKLHRLYSFKEHFFCADKINSPVCQAAPVPLVPLMEARALIFWQSTGVVQSGHQDVVPLELPYPQEGQRQEVHLVVGVCGARPREIQAVELHNPVVGVCAAHPRNIQAVELHNPVLIEVAQARVHSRKGAENAAEVRLVRRETQEERRKARGSWDRGWYISSPLGQQWNPNNQ